MKRYAVIDLGSNTVRMTVYDYGEEDECFRQILSEKETIGLLGYTAEGVLGEGGILRLTDTIKGFRETSEAIRADRLCCFATAGLRSIRNANAVAARVEAETGIRPNIISGEEEARLDFAGSFRPADENDGLVVDMGGGSTEFVRFCGSEMENALSLPFGSLFLYRRFVKKLLPKEQELRKIFRFIDKQTDCVEWLPGCARYICLIEGTGRAIARLHQEIYGRGNENLQGYTFRAKEIEKIFNLLKDGGKAGIRLLTKITPERVHTVIPGLAAYSRIMAITGCETVSISRSGVREGYLKEYCVKGR